jgi:hypothetical protein
LTSNEPIRFFCVFDRMRIMEIPYVSPDAWSFQSRGTSTVAQS